MKMEHTGINVEDPLKFTEWYCQHLGFRVVRQQTVSPFTTFLADPSNSVTIEIYNNPAASVPDYHAMDPLLVHLAFEVDDEPIEAVKQRLIEAGASEHKGLVVTPNGDQLIMLRDPWGMAIQLVHRTPRMI